MFLGYTNKKFNRVFLNSSQFIQIWNTNQVLYAVLDFHVTLHVRFGYPGQSIKACIRSYQTVDRFYGVEVLIKCTFSETQSPYLVSRYSTNWLEIVLTLLYKGGGTVYDRSQPAKQILKKHRT